MKKATKKLRGDPIVGVRLPATLIQEVDRQAQTEGRTRSQMIRHIVKLHYGVVPA